MGFWDSVSNFVSSVVSTVKETASSVWESTKKVAADVLGTLADVGGKVVGAVKDIYKEVKPYITVGKKVAQAISVATATTFPWISAAAATIAKGLDFLEKLESNPFVQKIATSIEWAVKIAQAIKTKILTDIEEKEAIKRQEELQKAMDLMKTEEQKQSVRFAMIINDYLLVKTRIEEALESFEMSESTNFEHYLRLRATQKLLQVTERKLNRATDIKEISADDYFLIHTGADLLAEDPKLTDADALRLDKLIKRRFNGKSLLPFVFEELIFSWQTKLESMEARWEKISKESVKAKSELRKLITKAKIEGLTFSEEVEYARLSEEVRDLGNELNEQATKNRAMQNYVYAAEGFLQVLEKTEDQWVKEDREWVLEDSSEVGMLLIQCVERDIHWDDLTSEQQSLINDFALVFQQDSKKRKDEINNENEEMVEVM